MCCQDRIFERPRAKEEKTDMKREGEGGGLGGGESETIDDGNR